MKPLSDRSTPDIVVLMLTVLVCVVLVLIIVGLTVTKITHPDIDLSKPGDAIFNMLSTIVGALVGFISGRAQGKYEQLRAQINGEETP